MVKKPSQNPERRSFLTKFGSFLAASVFSAALYPLYRFLGFHLPTKPVHIKVHKNLLPNGFLIHNDFILFNHPESPWAVSRTCTHLGCRLNLNENEKLLICPCHQSKFDFQGLRTAGPAIKNLPIFKVEPFSDGEGTGFIVTM